MTMGISQNLRFDYIKQFNLKKCEVALRDVTKTFRIVKNQTRLPRFKYKCYICFENFISHFDLVSHKTKFKNKACQEFTKVRLKTSRNTKQKQVGKSAYTCNNKAPTKSLVGIKKAPAKPLSALNKVPTKPLVSFDKVPTRLKTSSNTKQKQISKRAPPKPLVSFDKVPTRLKTSSNTKQKQIGKRVPPKSLVGIIKAPAKPLVGIRKAPAKPMVVFEKVPTKPLTVKKLYVQPKLSPSQLRRGLKTPDLSAANYAFVEANEDVDMLHYKCLRCEQLFISKFAVFRHVETAKCYINNCDVCTATFTKNSEFYGHYIADHTDRAICNFCFRTFTREKNVKEHMLRHLNLFRVRCQDCNKGFYTIREYRNHYKSRHMGIRHKCEACGRCFADEYYFRTHIAAHVRANRIAALQISH